MVCIIFSAAPIDFPATFPIISNCLFTFSIFAVIMDMPTAPLRVIPSNIIIGRVAPSKLLSTSIKSLPDPATLIMAALSAVIPLAGSSTRTMAAIIAIVSSRLIPAALATEITLPISDESSLNRILPCSTTAKSKSLTWVA